MVFDDCSSEGDLGQRGQHQDDVSSHHRLVQSACHLPHNWPWVKDGGSDEWMAWARTVADGIEEGKSERYRMVAGPGRFGHKETAYGCGE